METITIKIKKAKSKTLGCSICRETKNSEYLDITIQFPSKFEAGQIDIFLRNRANYGNYLEKISDGEISFILCQWDFESKFFPIRKKAVEKIDTTKLPLEFAITTEDFKNIIEENRYKRF